MEDDEPCNTGLCLGLGMEGYVAKKKKQREKQQVPFELCPKGDQEALHRLQDDEEEDGFTFMRIHHTNNNNNNSNNCRKKLRLTKDQSAVLENSFNLHSTLNPAQKQALADELNLKPRQVEVWFQNRRARTKLKQTEVECDLLKKCCENLTDENGRLKRELQELRALKVEAVSSPFYIQLSKAATLALCSSCQKLFKPNHSTKPE